MGLTAIESDLVKLAEDFYLVPAPHRGVFPFCNCFLITGDQTVLIDAGLDRKLFEVIEKIYRIDTLIITHSHPDHFFNWHFLRDRRLLMPEETPDSVTDLLRLGTRFTGSVKNGNVWKERMSDLLGLIPLRMPDGRFGDGEILDFGSVKLEAIRVPGHLNDHYCFLERERRLFLSTDIEFSSFGPWYGNPESSPALFRESIERVRRLPFETVCSSHRSPISDNISERFDVYLGIFDRHKEMARNLCDSPRTLDTMARLSPFYRDRLSNKKLQFVFERAMIEKNLELLLAEGRVESINSVYRLKKGVGEKTDGERKHD